MVVNRALDFAAWEARMNADLPPAPDPARRTAILRMCISTPRLPRGIRNSD